MPTLGAAKLQRLRVGLRDAHPGVSWDRGEANAALQAIENLLDTSGGAFGSAIEAAAPGVFNAAQKITISELVLAARLDS